MSVGGKRKMAYKNKEKNNEYRRKNRKKFNPKSFVLFSGTLEGISYQLRCKVLPTGGFDNRGYIDIHKHTIHTEIPEQHRKHSFSYYQRHKKEVIKKSREYRKTENGKISGGKHRAKRRCLNFIPLNKPFEGSSPHHINKNVVIFIPKEIHFSVYHNIWNGYGMEKINNLALNFLRSERAGAMKPET